MPRTKKQVELTPFQTQAIADQMGGEVIKSSLPSYGYLAPLTPLEERELDAIRQYVESTIETLKSLETQGDNNNGPETKAKAGEETGLPVAQTGMLTQPDTIFYHVNIGKNQWREAVLRVEVGATPESLAKVAETVNALNATFPLPATGGINEWYKNSLVYAYIAAASYQRLVKMLTSMAEIMVANPGEVIVGWGKQFANATIAEMADNPEGPSYMKWISSQQGTDVIRIQAAYEAYQIARGAKTP